METIREQIIDTETSLALSGIASSLEASGAGNCPDLKACMRDACIGACTDSPPEPEPLVA